MARPLRIQYSGARYHVMSRGDRREAIFYDDADRVEFLRTLGQACRKNRMAGACLLFDEQSFSSGVGDAATESGYWNEMAAGHLHAAVQPEASPLGTRLDQGGAKAAAQGRGQGRARETTA